MRPPRATIELHSVRSVALAASVIASLASAAGAPPATPNLVAPASQHASDLTNMRWRPIGPATPGGRIADFAVVDEDTFYVGVASGNLWKTTNRGTTWQSLFEDEQVNSIGDVTVAPSDPDIVWIGTGEANNRQSSPWGAGVYRSTDAGETWSHRGLTETRHIGRILVHPDDPDRAFVAAGGSLWGASEERGVFRTRDGGASWDKVLYIDADTGVTDMVMDPDDPDTVIAATYQRRRTECCFIGGGPGSGIYRTRDGGDSWTQLTAGLPDGNLGRIGLDIYQRDGSLVIATVEAAAPEGGIYRSSDGGDTWDQLNETNPRPMYFSQIRIDPTDARRVYVLGGGLLISDNGGVSFRRTEATGIHPDLHAMWIDPSDSDNVLLGHDGGVFVSADRAETWRYLDNLPIGQFYEIGVDMRDPYWVYGGLQDNGVWGGPSASRDPRGIRNSDWVKLVSGDGMYARIDPRDHNVIITETQNGALIRFNLATMERQSIRLETPGSTADGESTEPYRWNWDSPLIISEHDPDTLFAGGNVLFRSRDQGQAWEAISPDLSKAIDRETETIMGFHPVEGVLSLNDGVSTYGNMTTVSESPLNSNVIYGGTDDGNVQRTVDGGANWTDLTETFPGLPEFTSSSRLLASSHAEGRVYATFDGHQQDDMAPYVYASDDAGDTWRSIAAGLPDWSINVIAEHPRNEDLLFLGNELGLYVSLDRGGSWERLKNNLPTVAVDDIIVHPRDNDLIIGTHGRSVWILDDIVVLERLAAARATGRRYLFPVKPAKLFNDLPRNTYAGAAEFWAPNPPSSAVIRYRLPTAVQEFGGVRTVLLAITAPDGSRIRNLSGPGDAGLHGVEWDLRIDPAYPADEATRLELPPPPPAPRVLPGTYHARLQVGTISASIEVVVALASGLDASREDLTQRQNALLRAHDLTRDLYEGRRALRQRSEQTPETTAIDERIALAQRQLSSLASRIDGSTTRPTIDQLRAIELAEADTQTLLSSIGSQ